MAMTQGPAQPQQQPQPQQMPIPNQNIGGQNVGFQVHLTSGPNQLNDQFNTLFASLAGQVPQQQGIFGRGPIIGPQSMPIPFMGPQPQPQQHAHPHQHGHQHPPHQHPPHLHPQHHHHNPNQNQQRNQVAHALPFNVLQQLSRTIDLTMGPQVQFPGPSLPQLPGPRNPAQILGSYLHNLAFGLQRSIPMIERTAELLQREAYMTSPTDRRATESMCRVTKNILVGIFQAVQIFNFLRTLDLGNEPGAVRVGPLGNIPASSSSQSEPEPSQQPQQTQTPPPQQPQQQPQPQPQPQTQQQQPSQGNQQNQPQQQNQDNGDGVTIADVYDLQIHFDNQAQQGAGELQIQLGINSFADLPSILNNILQGQAGGQQQQPQQANNNNNSSNNNVQPPQDQNVQGVQGQNPLPQQQQAQGQQQPQMLPFNPMAMLGGLLGGGGGQQGGGQDPFSMTIKDLMMQNLQSSMEPGEQEMLEVFDDVKLGDIMGAQLTGNWTFLDNLHPRIKVKLQEQIEKSGSKEEFARLLGQSIVSFMVPEEQDKHRVIEEFDVQTVTAEIMQTNMLKLFEIVNKDYTGVNRFSNSLIEGIKLMMGEVVAEVSEGLNNGIEDLKVIFTHSSQTLLNKTVGPQMAMMAGAILNDVIWQQVLASHALYLKHKEQEAERQRSLQQSEVTEEQLIQQIQQLPNYQPTQLSDSYKRGDPGFKDYQY